MSRDFQERLFPILPEIIKIFGTPFFIYDEKGIWETCESLARAFEPVKRLAGFQEFFAAKANTNPSILDIFSRFGFGFDDSSIFELQETRSSLLKITGGNQPGRIMFTSNNTSNAEFAEAIKNGGCILNLDDISLIEKAPLISDLFCIRYNPGGRRKLDSVIGKTGEQKYGVMHSQVIEAFRMGIAKGAKRFGLHTMIVSNELNYKCMVETVVMLLEVVELIHKKLNIQMEFINMGGGLGIPYKPGDVAIPIMQMGAEIYNIMKAFQNKHGFVPKLFLESARYMTGPHGILVATCINKKDIYLKFRGMDVSCSSSMPRPFIYWPDGGYHHISVFNAEGRLPEKVNIVGSACENADQFGRDRLLPEIKIGDIIIVHDAGAHCYAMHFNYNGRLAPQELLLNTDGSVKLIRRAETEDDLRATFNFPPKIWTPSK